MRGAHLDGALVQLRLKRQVAVLHLLQDAHALLLPKLAVGVLLHGTRTGTHSAVSQPRKMTFPPQCWARAQPDTRTYIFLQVRRRALHAIGHVLDLRRAVQRLARAHEVLAEGTAAARASTRSVRTVRRQTARDETKRNEATTSTHVCFRVSSPAESRSPRPRPHTHGVLRSGRKVASFSSCNNGGATTKSQRARGIARTHTGDTAGALRALATHAVLGSSNSSTTRTMRSRCSRCISSCRFFSVASVSRRWCNDLLFAASARLVLQMCGVKRKPASSSAITLWCACMRNSSRCRLESVKRSTNPFTSVVRSRTGCRKTPTGASPARNEQRSAGHRALDSSAKITASDKSQRAPDTAHTHTTHTRG